jgi:hypothetical protein
VRQLFPVATDPMDPVNVYADLPAATNRRSLPRAAPGLNGQLAGRGLLDELCLTPSVIGGDSKRILSGPSLDGPCPVRLASICEDDGLLFLRDHVRAAAGGRNASASPVTVSS